MALMIERLVLFGATGDLTGRLLLPAIAALYDDGTLSRRFRIVGAAQKELSDQSFRELAAERLQAHAPNASQAAREALLDALTYRRVDIRDSASVGAVLHDSQEPVGCYLALPNSLFATAVTAIEGAGLPAGSRIAVEKPFGTDLTDARALNAQLANVYDDRSIYRVDHALGMPTVRAVLPFRRNPVIDVLWNSKHVEQIDVLWEETLALENRAGYYDRAGALKDVMQNHMLQVLCVAAMELPNDGDLHDRRIEFLGSVRPPRPEEMKARTQRARYTAGRIGSRNVPDYARERGVDAKRGTETLAEVELTVDNDRWSGTRFVMRAAKAFATRRKEIVVRFRNGSNELRIGIDGPNDIRWHLDNAVLTAPPPRDSELPAYAHVLSDFLAGGSDLSVRGDEAEEAWRIFTPVLEAWASQMVPLEEYAAGSEALRPRSSTAHADVFTPRTRAPAIP